MYYIYEYVVSKSAPFMPGWGNLIVPDIWLKLGCLAKQLTTDLNICIKKIKDFGS